MISSPKAEPPLNMGLAYRPSFFFNAVDGGGSPLPCSLPPDIPVWPASAPGGNPRESFPTFFPVSPQCLSGVLLCSRSILGTHPSRCLPPGCLPTLSGRSLKARTTFLLSISIALNIGLDTRDCADGWVGGKELMKAAGEKTQQGRAADPR